MTDVQTTGGSGTALTPAPGILPTAANGAADQGSNGGTGDPFSGLVDPGIRDWVGKAGVKDVESLAKKARDAEGLIGRSIQLPAADAKPEEWTKVYDRMGRPKDANGYEFALPQGLPADFAYDGERVKAFKADAHEAGLTPKQAAVLHDAEVKRNAEAFGKLQETVKAAAVTATQALEKAYGGPPNSDAFKSGVEMAIRAIDGLDKIPGVSGIKKALESGGLLLEGIVVEPSIAIALTHIGKALFSEDKLVGGTGSGSAEANPFADGGNLTIQMQTINQDKEKARRLILAVGKQPADWGIV